MDTNTAFKPTDAPHAPLAPTTSLPDSYGLYRAARAHRAQVLGDMIGTAIGSAMLAVVAFARGAHVRYLQQREARRVRDALGELDDRMLRDLGFDRSEIASVAAELSGEAERTRVRTFQSLRILAGARRMVPSGRVDTGAVAQGRHDEKSRRRLVVVPTPRFALGLTAVVMAVVTISLFVVMPAGVDSNTRVREVQVAPYAPVAADDDSPRRLDVAAAHDSRIGAVSRPIR